MSASPKRPYSICGLERTFIAELTNKERKFVLFGMGPNIYPVEKKEIPIVDREIVFSTVPVQVKNIVNMLEEGFLLAYGDSYIAWMPAGFLATGGVVCDSRVMSTGRTIHFIRKIDKKKIKIYYEDGTADFVEIGIEGEKIRLKTLGIFKFCLGLLEKVTCVTSCNETCWLGTSLGNVLSVQPSELIDIYSLNINDPIKQLLANMTTNGSFCMLLYQSGNIAIYHLEKKNITKHLPGRFTVLSDQFDVIPSNNGNMTLLVGDRDGNLTNLEIDPYSGDMRTDRVIKGHTANRITVIKYIEHMGHAKIYYGTVMGTLHYYNLTETPDLLALSSGITFSEFSGMPSFTGRSQPHILHKYCVGYGHTIGRDPFKNKPNKFLQTRLFSNQSCEILCRFGDQECYLWLLDYSSSKKQMLSINADISGKKSKFTIVQVVVMEKHILIQFANETAELHRYNLENKTTVPMMNIKTRGRITTALVASGMNQQAHETNLNLNGSYIVSMAKTRFNMGIGCLMLSANGRILLVAPNMFMPRAAGVGLCTYREDLTRQIGNGHSLVETNKGTLVVGWRGNVLNIFCHKEDCYVKGEAQLTAITHVISLPTAYPKRIVVSQQIHLQTWKPADSLVIHMAGYQNEKWGVVEKVCPIIQPQEDTCLTHTNIITAVTVVDYAETRMQSLITGDKDGILCLWLVLPPQITNINKLNLLKSYKLNGAITCICSTIYMVAVATSQGEITLYAKSPQIPGYYAQKQVDCLLTNKPNEYYLICLGTDHVLRRIHVCPGTKMYKTTLKWKISAFKIYHPPDIMIIILGCPDGHAFIAIFHPLSQKYIYFHIDRLHKHPIIDANSKLYVSGEHLFVAKLSFTTLDISGMVVARNFLVKHGQTYRDPKPLRWQCSVPSPQKIVYSDVDGGLFVFGKGYASRSLSDRSTSKAPTVFENYNLLAQK